MPLPSVTYQFVPGTTASANQVNTNNQDIINAMTDGLKDFTIGSIVVNNASTFNGDVALGNNTGDTITVAGNISIAGTSTFSALTATTVPVLNASKQLISSAVTPTELAFLSGMFSQPVTRAAHTMFTGGGTWTKATLNPKFIRITVTGGGGGGAGVGSVAAGENGSSGGGGGGGTSIKLILAASLGTTETVTIGGAGSAGAAGGAGGTGGTSSFGSHASATGGSGGSPGSGSSGTAAAAAGGVGGVGSSGDMNFNGGGGGTGRTVAGGSVPCGFGGNSYFGGNTLCTGGIGNAGVAYGAGGAGSTSPASTPARVGSAGGAGVVMVEEFY